VHYWQGYVFCLALLITDVIYTNNCNRGQAVAQLVEALRYKPEGRGFVSQRRHWNFSLT
jgi:hypothetical protein